MLYEHIERFLGVFSYPFCSVDFLKEDLLQKYYDAEDNNDIQKLMAIKDKIRSNFCQDIQKKFTIYSYDEIYQYIELWYLNAKNNESNEKSETFDVVWEKLNIFTKCFITQRDGKICYKYWENENDKNFLYGFSGSNKIYLFHNLNLLMPSDILTSIHFVKTKKLKSDLNGYYGNVLVSDLMLDKILDKGVAENHLHAGVASSFLTTWSDFMSPLTAMNYRYFDDLPIYPSTEEDNKKNKFYIWLASITRGYLIECIASNCGNACKINIPFGNKEEFSKMEYKFISNVDLMNEFFLKECEELQDCINFQKWKEEARKIDTLEELVFMYDIVKFINENKSNEKNKKIQQLFLDYLRIKNCIYSQMTQQKHILGLDYFQSQFYNKSSTMHYIAGEISKNNKWERALNEQLRNGKLIKLELRGTIKNEEKEVYKDLLDLLKAYYKILKRDYCIFNGEKYVPSKPFPKIGLVYHLIKSEKYQKNCVKYSKNNITALQYGELYEEYKTQISILKEIRKKEYFDKFIVGLDVASLESSVPTWVFTNIFNNARDSDYEKLNDNQSLSFTFHAGEDFRHLISGLRRIHEVVFYLKFHAGDRIGHGIALGIDIDNWISRNPTVVLPRIEVLENYLWVYSILKNSNLSSYIENNILSIAEEIYGQNCNISVQMLLNSYTKVFTTKNLFENLEKNFKSLKNDKLDSLEKCELFNCSNWTLDNIFYSRHCSVYSNKMNQPINYKITSEEIEIIRLVQEYMKDFISNRGIIIEINPSSNIILGNFDTLNNLHIYSLNKNKLDFGNIITCVNSDDPSVFNTNVFNELGYAYLTLIEQGVARENVLQWVEKLRHTGVDASFIRNDLSDESMLSLLKYMIEKDL